VYQVRTVPINSNQLQLIATDAPDTFNIASPPDSNGASSLTFCKHPHYLIRLRAIYKNDPDKSGYYGNDPDNFYIKKMTSVFFCASLLARQNGIRLKGEMTMQPEMFIMYLSIAS
jgi:hypothetical protein